MVWNTNPTCSARSRQSLRSGQAMRCTAGQLPDETPCPVEPKPPRATVVVLVRPADGTDVPEALDVVEVRDVDDRDQIELPDPEELDHRRDSRQGSAGCPGPFGATAAGPDVALPGATHSVRGAMA
jgi:hypothetical protein